MTDSQFVIIHDAVVDGEALHELQQIRIDVRRDGPRLSLLQLDVGGAATEIRQISRKHVIEGTTDDGRKVVYADHSLAWPDEVPG